MDVAHVALILEFDHGHSVSWGVEQPHVREHHVLDAAKNLAADGNAVRGDASHVVDVDTTGRSLADINIRNGPIDLNSGLNRDIVVAGASIVAVLKRAVLTAQRIEPVSVRVERGRPGTA